MHNNCFCCLGRKIEGYINNAQTKKIKDISLLWENLNATLDSDSSFSSNNSDDNDSTNDNYEDIMQQLLEKSDAANGELRN